MFVVVVVVVTVVVDYCCTLVMAILLVLITNLRNTPVYCCRFFVVTRVWDWGSVDVGTFGKMIHYPSRRLGRILAGWERTASYYMWNHYLGNSRESPSRIRAVWVRTSLLWG